MTNTAKKIQPTIVNVAIIGAGFGGLTMAMKLREAGITDFVILEKAPEVGGAWYYNRYPGAACDVQSHLYSFSNVVKPDWSKRYAPAEEIEKYIIDAVEQQGLRKHIQFGQEVTAAHFDKDSGTWAVSTKDGGTVICNHFVNGSGPLHVPNKPDIKGLDKFKGKVMHSAEWDHGYDLIGKNVISIGTGGSAIQYCPEIAPKVKKLSVFQRTPAWVIPRDERKYWGVEKLLFKKFPLWQKLHRAQLYWSNETRVAPAASPTAGKLIGKLASQFIKLQVKDKELVKKLTPNYTFGCKRVLISNVYYPMFNRDNVELVTAGIKEVKANSVITDDGVEHAADCIVLGTGFVVDPRIYMKDFPLTGLPGHDLNVDWKENAEAYNGITVHGFPNMYLLVGPNTGLGHNSILFMIEAQANYIVKCINMLKDKNAMYFNVKKSAQEAFSEDVQRRLAGTTWTSGCVSWYQQADGKNVALWPGSTWRYWLQTRSLNQAAYELYSQEQVEKEAEAAAIVA